MMPSVGVGCSVICVPFLAIVFSRPQIGGLKVNPRDCGLSQPLSRIINGTPVEKPMVPWVVQLELVISGNQSNTCSGSIISRDFVMTAAHCIDSSVKNIYVYFNTTSLYGGPYIEAECGVVHPSYVNRGVENDIALVKLKEPLPPFDNYVRAVCLPRKDKNIERKRLLVAGYGAISANDTPSKKLRYYWAMGQSEKQCADHLVKGRHSILNPLKVMCISDKHSTVWTGDSGGPITALLQDGRATQLGVVSFGPNSTEPGVTRFNTRVSSYFSWVKEAVRNVMKWTRKVLGNERCRSTQKRYN